MEGAHEHVLEETGLLTVRAAWMWLGCEQVERDTAVVHGDSHVTRKQSVGKVSKLLGDFFAVKRVGHPDGLQLVASHYMQADIFEIELHWMAEPS
ncbi:hypothetical protein SCP_0100190 [Sparassis crispa]|uniref:Uncharacterized protein n=1 Tax=Sparassis crispa TaxID=139825 RepID=A0A401G4N0_9APHY|nr:hypothetical protein SCP_0100190 [Sparassis crispa]GBE77147.1 hypothetical protein SCP_0100190 [Sparassis crispa]